MSEDSSTSSRPATPANVVAGQTPTARPYRFTWDPSSRRPGPESVSGTTEGRGGEYLYQSTLTPFPLGALSTSTTPLASSALPNEWSSSKHGFHAISTVLNNPHKKQAPPKAHSSLPAVPPADLPRVRRKDFDSYLKAIAPEWELFERNNKLGLEGQAQLDSSTLQSHDDDNNITPRASIASDSEHTPTASAPPPLPTSSSSSRRGSLVPGHSRTIPPLDNVPSVFFEQGFNLADPATFAKATEQPNNIVPHSSSADAPTPLDYITDPTSSLSHTPPLLDKFSYYADTVEQHLVREISLRSTSFFAALTNLQDLQSESDICLDRIAKLRNLLKDVDERTAKKGLDVVRKFRIVDKVRSVRGAVRGVGSVVEMTRVATSLVGAGQWGEALGVVEELERMWDGDQLVDDVSLSGAAGKKLEVMVEEAEDEEEGMQEQRATLGFPLSTLTAFSELPSHLRALTLEIATSLSQELVIVLHHDLEDRVSHNQWVPAKINGHITDKEKDPQLRDRLKPLLQYLVRSKGLKDAISRWRDVVMGDIRGVAKAAVSGFDKEWDEDKEENRAALAQHLRAMEHSDFMPLLQRVYQRFLALIEGVQAQNILINDLLESLQKPTGPGQPSLSRSQNIADDLSDLHSSITELSHITSSKLLHPRTEPHSTLSLPLFLALYFDSMAFVVKCEVICRRMIIGLRGVIIRQASVYLSKFHQGRVEKCARVVLDEMWNQVEVGAELQGVVDVLVRCAVKDAVELKVDSEGAVFGSLNPTSTVNGGVNGKGNGVLSTSSPTPPSKSPTLRNLPPTKTFAELSETGTISASGSKESTKSNGSGKGNTKHLRIEDRSYYIVSATTEILILLVDYLKIVVNLSTLTKDTINKVVEFLMTFNSRTCQLVLGAGAMRSAGLKHITAKHLALASQSLSVVSELIPYVRETFRRHLNQAEAVLLVDFDKLKRHAKYPREELLNWRAKLAEGQLLEASCPCVFLTRLLSVAQMNDYQVHQTEIHAKLISIMGDRLTAHIETLKACIFCDLYRNTELMAIDWTQPSEGSVNGYMQTLIKETVTLHKVLSRYLSPAVVEYVMTEVFAGINHRLSEVYGKIELPNQDAKARLLADAKFLHKELSGLKNAVAPMGMLETVVSEKQIPRANVPSTVPSPTRSNTLTANQRLKGLLSRSSTSANHSNKPVEKALPVLNQTATNPRTSTSTPPPPLPAKSPAGSLFIQNSLASASTLVLSSGVASESNLELNVSTSTAPDHVLSASPPIVGAISETQGMATTSSPPSQQNGHEARTPAGSPRITPVEIPLPETPSTERGTDMKV